MSTLAPPPPKRSARKGWTVEEFHEVYSSPELKARRPYLIRGTVWDQGEMNPPHANCLEALVVLFVQLFATEFRVRCQLPLVFGLDTDPMPDLCLIRKRADAERGTHPTSAELVIEVSDTTLFEDRTTKAELYATAGIAEYWIVDLNSSVLLVFRDPQPLPEGSHAYRSQRTLDRGEEIAPLAKPEAIVRVADLLP